MMGLLWGGLIIGTLYGKHRLTFLHQRIRTYMTSSNWPQIPGQKWILDHQMKKNIYTDKKIRLNQSSKALQNIILN
ncbi:MAG: hypothetical protein Ct9H300mP9_7410 [Candidatus Neomarinimicrobiota bacterium]|nr:MAG: hypothetical protein Ct9H300mP9_7410 [Candidatus Neomarinimicrobiota bacterium]